MTEGTRQRTVGGALLVAAVCAAMFAVGALLIGGCAGVKAFNRAQKRADANNDVKVTSIRIRQAQQQAHIVAAQDATVKAKADQRVIEARGIRDAQDIISRTLTDRYLQHEAIQAQERTASSGQNNTVVYVPSGPMGVPLVNNIAAAQQAK